MQRRKKSDGERNNKTFLPEARLDKDTAAKEELERLLSNAVKEYEDDFATREQKEEAARAGEDFRKFRAKRRTSNIVNKMAQAEDVTSAEMFKKIIDDCNNPNFGDSIQNTLKILSGNVEGIQTISQLVNHLQPKVDREKQAEQNDVTFVIGETLDHMSRIPQHMQGVEPAAMEQTGEDIMTAMIAEFERFGEKEDYQNFIEANLRQLLSKEIMYVPVKKLCDKFPEWLAIQEDYMSKEEYERFGHQYQDFQRLKATYETEPDNFQRLVEIMYDIQEYGQPPADIIKELAPGLEFNEEGLPMMANMGGNMFPHMPNVPFPDVDKCNIM